MGRKRKKSKGLDTNKFLLYSLSLIIILLIFTFYSEANGIHLSDITNELANETISTNTITKVTPIDTGGNTLTIYFFDVGQADSVFISTGGSNMLIDAGNNSDGKLVSNYLKNDLGITKLDYLVGTHNHEDHIGGLDDIIKNLEIENLYMPYVSVTSTKTYENVENAALKKDIEIKSLEIGDTFSLGNAEFNVMNINNNEPKNKNEASIVLQMQFGSKRFLFTGDTEVENENSRNWDDIDVLKVAHHGSKTSSSEKFLNQTKPEIAIISAGPNNSYGLPNEIVLNRLENIGATIYRTDELGTILLTSDGTNYEIQTLKDVCLDGNER